MITDKDVLDALGVIIDPDFKKDIVSLGFVKNIKIDGGSVNLDIELTTPACPIKSEFQKSAEEILSSLPGVEKVKINMTAREVKKSEKNKNGLSGVRNLIAISSSKGGVGKSTVAANIARELSARGFKTGLLDADIFGPSIPTLFNLHKIDIQADKDKNMIPVDLNGLKIMSFGFFLGDSPAILRGPIVSGYIQQLLTGVAWGELDYLIIDMPPGTGDIQLTMTQTVQLTGAVIVTTREALSLVDGAKGIEMFETVNVPMLGIVENMSHFICDNCEKKHYLFGSDQENVITEKYGLETLLELPIKKSITNHLEKPHSDPDIKALVDKVARAIGKMTFAAKSTPQYEFDDEKLKFVWSDGTRSEVKNIDLRADCGCAVCVDEYSGEKLLKREDLPSDVKPTDITPLGNYALKITWSDGHSSGIYPYKQIRKLETLV
ncbi:MAG: P-loop NTPase [Spirochaetales bacterium]|nr:P-loop NTPase [Spirochaetales bacterium]